DELSVLRVLHDTVVRSVAVGDEDIPVRSSHDTGRRSEMVLIISGNTGFAQRQLHFSIGAELAHDVPSFYSRLGCGCHRVFGRCLGYPHITLAVDVHPMRPNKHLRPKALNDIALRVELVDGVVRFEFTVGIHTVETEPASTCNGYGACLIAPDEGPDTLAINVNVD